jgi:hypothetical protein
MGHAQVIHSRRGCARYGSKCGGRDQPDRRERQHRRLRPCPDRIEALLRVPHSPRQHGGAKHEQNVANDGTRDRSLHDVMQTGAQGRKRNDEFGRVAEGCVEKSSNAFTEVLRELLCRPPHAAGKRQDRQR